MKLSIITPVYNGEQYIENFTKAILKQDYTDFEFIIVNDGSKDNTKVICDRLKGLDNRIKVIHTENQGVSSARNTGIEIANGDYISFVDCDDKMKPSMYVDMINLLEEKAVDIILTGYFLEFNDRTEEYNYPFADRYFNMQEIKDDLLMRLIVKMDKNDNYIESIYGAVWKCLFKRSVIMDKNIRFNKNMKVGEDLVFLLTYLNSSKSAFVTNKKYYIYNKTTADGISVMQGYKKNLESDYDYINKQVLDIINDENFTKSLAWKNKKLRDSVELAINETSKFSEKSNSERIKAIKDILKRTSFNSNLNVLGKDKAYGINNKTLFLLKNKLIYIFVLLFLRKQG